MPLLAGNVCSTPAPFCQPDCQPFQRSVIAFSSSVPHVRAEGLVQFHGSRNCVLGGDVQHAGRTPRGSSGGDGSRSSAGLSFDLPARAVSTKVCSVQGQHFSKFARERRGATAGSGMNLGRRGGSTGNGEFHFVLDYLLGGSLSGPSKSRKGLVISCSITVPVPNEHSSVDNVTKTKSADISQDSSAGNESKISSRETVKAAFFDVDGTITRTNVVLAYLSVRMTELSFLKKLVWLPWFALCCIAYLFVDHIHRPSFNRIFYLNYKGRPADGKIAMANLIYERYYKPRIMAGAVEQIQELKQLGYHIVLVTGALDFQIAPLARDLGADFVYAAKLVEKNGRFTGEMNGMGTSNSEKAERVWDYAKRFGVSLRESLAFGDSIADLAMLEVVGKPHAVNPDARLQAIALKRGWAILRWFVNKQKMNAIVSA